MKVFNKQPICASVKSIVPPHSSYISCLKQHGFVWKSAHMRSVAPVCKTKPAVTYFKESFENEHVE